MREYGIDLMERIDGMSWRRFACLIRGLSPGSAAAGAAERAALDDRAAARAFFEQMRGG